MSQFHKMAMMTGPIPQKTDKTIILSDMLPSFKTFRAHRLNVQHKVLLWTWGGIGDQICTEPTLRHALRFFRNCEISLASDMPELFEHLKFKKVYDLRKEKPDEDQYITFKMIHPAEHLSWEFICHSICNAVDYPTLNAFRCQLPIAEKEVTLKPNSDTVSQFLKEIVTEHRDRMVLIHAGKHWPSKTFPKDWWDATIDSILAQGLLPVLVGKEAHDGQGTVDTKTDGCLDLREKTTVMESVWLTQQAKVVFCNDSSVLHMAITGDAWVGFIATCKHPDFISHWRQGRWSWRMENLGVGGIWELSDNCPNKMDTTKVDEATEAQVRSWLPDPKIVGPWCAEKMKAYDQGI